MIAKVTSGAVVGLEAQPVDVEVDVANGLPAMIIVGLPDKAVQESKERVRSAIKSSGIGLPSKRIVANLAPADLRKEGPAYDLPMALGIARGLKAIPDIDPNWIFVGELSLDGELRHTSGILPVVLMAKDRGYHRVFVPQVNAREASLVQGIEIMGVESLAQLIAYLNQDLAIAPARNVGFAALQQNVEYQHDMSLVKGQEHVKRALEIAAAGGHNILMSGPPGSGKTMLARTMPSILPDLTIDEALECTKIYSVSGNLPADVPLVTQRPFRSPHHTTSRNALVGGGGWPKPGEISLAHRGVLFLDEFPEFPSQSLEALRQPLEDGVVTISRVQGTLTFPARFVLVAAMNPCPCGFATDPDKECTCSVSQISRYRKRISGPLVDRIDMVIEVPRVRYEKIAQIEPGEPSGRIRQRVQKARLIQQRRFAGIGSRSVVNGDMNAKDLRCVCEVNEAAQKLLKLAMSHMQLSGRSYHRILKLARTIADLDALKYIEERHVAEAVSFKPDKENIFH